MSQHAGGSGRDEAMSLTIEIPGLPPMNTADGLSRWTRRKIRERWVRHVQNAVLASRARPAAPWSRARVTITRCSSSEPDSDNLYAGAKFLLDGLKAARVIEDDKPSVIGMPDCRWERAPRGAGCVRIHVEPMAVYQGVEIGPRVLANPTR